MGSSSPAHQSSRSASSVSLVSQAELSLSRSWAIIARFLPPIAKPPSELSYLTYVRVGSFRTLQSTVWGLLLMTYSCALYQARVLTVHDTDLRNLCRCVEGLPEVHTLNKKLPNALQASYDFCDTTDNPYFVDCKAHGRSGCRKHPLYTMNISQGMYSVTQLPNSGCGTRSGAQSGNECLAYQLPDKHITTKRSKNGK